MQLMLSLVSLLVLLQTSCGKQANFQIYTKVTQDRTHLWGLLNFY